MPYGVVTVPIQYYTTVGFSADIQVTPSDKPDDAVMDRTGWWNWLGK